MNQYENKEKYTHFSNEYHHLEFISDVLVQTYHPNLKHITLSVAKILIEERNTFSKRKKYPLLVLTQNGRSINNDA